MSTEKSEGELAISELEKWYGPAEPAGMGNAVVVDPLPVSESLEAVAKQRYQWFVGKMWQSVGEAAWLENWKEVYRRPEEGQHDILAELKAISDRDARQSVPLMIADRENAAAASAALQKVYDSPKILELRVFNLGDGGAMSGLIVAGRTDDEQTVQVIFLMD